MMMMKFSSCVLAVLALLNRAEAKCCMNGFTGDHCEIEPTPCTPDPCKNGGVCSEHGSAVHCECINGFTGNRCRIDPCIPGSCRNGVCEAGNCTCTPGFYGELCGEANHVKGCYIVLGVEPVDDPDAMGWNTFRPFRQTLKAITKIKVYHDTLGGGSERQYLHGIEAWYGDDVSTLGGSRNGTEGECALSPGEYITEVKHLDATYGGNIYVGKLEFVTNLKTCGPFGVGEGIMTSFKSNNVVGFSGIFIGSTSTPLRTLAVYFLVCPED